MVNTFRQSGLRAISGEDTSAAGKLVRATTGVIEPFYSVIMRLRNACYDHGIFATHNLGRPAVSVGNITTGGTGKTPVVQWLAEQLRSRGHQPAILMRGYGSKEKGISDESQLLDRALNQFGVRGVPLQASPSRISGAARVLKEHPEVDVFILDDAFQHRRARRDFNLVLISATNPFGYQHVLPRGLLREPLSGLGRADAVLVTRCELAGHHAVEKIDRYLKLNVPAVPAYHCDHHHAGLWLSRENKSVPMNTISAEKVFIAAGIGDPASFQKQIESTGCTIVGARWFDDHHSYSAIDNTELMAAARSANAGLIITTEKDWVKLEQHVSKDDVPLAVVQLRIKFHEGDEQLLLDQIRSTIQKDGQRS